MLIKLLIKKKTISALETTIDYKNSTIKYTYSVQFVLGTTYLEKNEYLEITFLDIFDGTSFILGGKLQNDAKCEEIFELLALCCLALQHQQCHTQYIKSKIGYKAKT